MKWYGSIENRLAEGKNYAGEIKVGTDITMYYWSDRKCYYVTKVIDEKHIFVRKYEVVADREKEGGMGHQNWVYFKSAIDCNNYLKRYGLGTNNPSENPENEWVFRYGHWNLVDRYNLDRWNACLDFARKDVVDPSDEVKVYNCARFYFKLSDAEFEKVKAGKEIVKYKKLDAAVSFGVRDYYYDWEY